LAIATAPTGVGAVAGGSIAIAGAVTVAGAAKNTSAVVVLLANKTAGPTTDPNTGSEVGRFVADDKGNVMIEPKGGSTVPAGKKTPGQPQGEDTHTLYPNGSNYQRLNPNGHTTNATPHGHGHQQGSGSNKRGQGASLSPDGRVVPAKSPDAHWPIHK
jgi:hypothetical protein